MNGIRVNFLLEKELLEKLDEKRKSLHLQRSEFLRHLILKDLGDY